MDDYDGEEEFDVQAELNKLLEKLKSTYSEAGFILAKSNKLQYTFAPSIDILFPQREKNNARVSSSPIIRTCPAIFPRWYTTEFVVT